MKQFHAADDELDDSTSRSSRASWRNRTFLGVFVALIALLVADWRGTYEIDVAAFGTEFTGLDWLFLFALAVVVFYLVVPLVVRRERTFRYWRGIRKNGWATASFAVLATVTFVGLVGPVFVGLDQPLFGTVGAYTPRSGQPPVGFSALTAFDSCIGELVNGRCHGTWQYPFGTTVGGNSVLGFTIAGARVAVEIATITVALIVPLATVVGTTAATYGGRVDELLMRYVDVQQSIPAFFVILIASDGIAWITEGYGGSLLLVVLVFGFLSWGGIARIVRSEALRIQEKGYVRAARNAGASRFDVVTTHVVPNALPAALTAVTVQISWILLLETTLAYLEITGGVNPSWGYLMRTSMHADLYPTLYWWGVAIPAVVMGLVVVSLQYLGDALQTVTDPRTE